MTKRDGLWRTAILSVASALLANAAAQVPDAAPDGAARRHALHRGLGNEPASFAADAPLRDCASCPEMVPVPAGNFRMGTELEGTREIAIAHSFAIGRTEITQGQWLSVMGRNPSQFGNCGLDCPVESVSWEEAREFARRLSERTGQTYRLPTEAEWEYAWRAGDREACCAVDDIGDKAWYDGNSEGHPHAVATKAANAWGIQDMSGNVWEWVEDCWHESFNGAPTDGSAWIAGNCDFHVLRGGSWNFSALFARTGARYWGRPSDRSNFFGFRVVRMVVR